MLKISHSPDGKAADALALTLACTTAANALVNYRLYVPQRPSNVQKFPSPDGIFTCLLSVCRAVVFISTVVR